MSHILILCCNKIFSVIIIVHVYMVTMTDRMLGNFQYDFINFTLAPVYTKMIFIQPVGAFHIIQIKIPYFIIFQDYMSEILYCLSNLLLLYLLTNSVLMCRLYYSWSENILVCSLNDGGTFLEILVYQTKYWINAILLTLPHNLWLAATGLEVFCQFQLHLSL
jgi:hypothetical protein